MPRLTIQQALAVFGSFHILHYPLPTFNRQPREPHKRAGKTEVLGPRVLEGRNEQAHAVPQEDARWECE